MARKKPTKRTPEAQESSPISPVAGSVSASPPGLPPNKATSSAAIAEVISGSALRLPAQRAAAPLGFQTMVANAAPRSPDLTSATQATIPTTAAVISRPTQCLIAAKTGFQGGAGLRVFGPGQRAGIRVVRM
jgi:hypothetical protein